MKKFKTEYTVLVQREEAREANLNDLIKEHAFRIGKYDRLEGIPPRSAAGPYLDGWHSPEKEFMFIPAEQCFLLGQDGLREMAFRICNLWSED